MPATDLTGDPLVQPSVVNLIITVESLSTSIGTSRAAHAIIASTSSTHHTLAPRGGSLATPDHLAH